jgi:hypothetical protein
MKTCSKCKEVKPKCEFHKDKKAKDGLQPRCKSCRKNHYEANREQILSRQKVYNEGTKDQKAIYDKTYREANKEKISVAYIHCKPDGTPFYVGKGTLARAKNPNRLRNKHYVNTVAKYGIENIGVSIVECSTDEISLELEIGLIKCLKRMGVKLTNLTDGGEGKRGCPNSEDAYRRGALNRKGKGYTHSEETRKRMSVAHTGKARSEETKAKISAGLSQHATHPDIYEKRINYNQNKEL